VAGAGVGCLHYRGMGRSSGRKIEESVSGAVGED